MKVIRMKLIDLLCRSIASAILFGTSLAWFSIVVWPEMLGVALALTGLSIITLGVGSKIEQWQKPSKS